MDVVLADRLQFAFTIMFHYLFPITTMGLAPFVAWYTIRAAKTGAPDELNAARFWTKIFAVNFAIGVVSGIPMEFQFGTNWAIFSAKAGSVVGQPLAMEGLYAFFLESIFLGALFYNRGGRPTRLQATASVSVLGSRDFSSSRPMRGCSTRLDTRARRTVRCS
jgi:cytochrome d ubiquinol oxidase subunit I